MTYTASPSVAALRSKLRRVASRYLAVSQLKKDILKRTAAFCPCDIARDYHIGAHDACALLEEYAVDITPDGPARTAPLVRTVVSPPKEKLLRKVDASKVRCDQEVFVPLEWSQKQEDEQLSILAAAHDRICGVLTAAYKDAGFVPPREPGEPPFVPRAVMDQAVEAFENLMIAGYLPPGPGSSVFSPLGMALLMSSCFPENDDDLFIAYLKNPTVLLDTEHTPSERTSVRGRVSALAAAALLIRS